MKSPPHASTPAGAPEFLKLLAHDVRWQLVHALAQSDLRVQELVDRVHKPINLVSYHLKLLRDGEIVRERRSSADGREFYYSLDLAYLGRLYRGSGRDLHPALLAPVANPLAASGWPPAAPAPLRVLFVCTHNRARSQMAEGILRHLGGGDVAAFSAGLHPGPIHPLAVAAVAEMGIDIARSRAKHLDEFRDQSFELVITVCDQAREQCPTFVGDPPCTHWSIPDPIAAAETAGSAAAQMAIFRKTAEELAQRIRCLLAARSAPSGYRRPTPS